ncbi:MAG TPA: S26 family signal peptidase [Candidatus Limnocylindrales bacterium]|nr:S26 family signal peptidase [Candidatus Limnocylindrales bacterium]
MTKGTERAITLREAIRGLWRVTVVDGSMTPAIHPGDWLLVDPTVRCWPRRGTIVVFREPFTDLLAIKRVAARPGDWVPFADGWLQLGDDEAWLLGDATDAELAAAGHGTANDSRRYGPVPVEALVGRAWLRYGPIQRIGLPAPAPMDLLARGRSGSIPAAAVTASPIGLPAVVDPA